MNVISIFCEDIRDEVGGSVSLIGIMPDNVEVPSPNGALPRLAIYTRINLSVEEPVEEMSCFLRLPDGQDVAHTSFSVEQVEKAFQETKSQQNSIVGFIARIQTSPFPARPGRVLSIVNIRGREHVAGSMNILVNERKED